MNTYRLPYHCILIISFLSLSTAIAQHNEIKDTTKKTPCLPSYFPLDREDFVRVSSKYGVRNHPILKKIKMHHGIDLVATKGKPVYAAADGTVGKSDFVKGYGNRILLAHGEEIKTLYGHLWVRMVQKGDTVKQGQIIGFVGDTGRVTGPHLHYEIWLKNKKVDPQLVWKNIVKREYQEIAINQY